MGKTTKTRKGLIAIDRELCKGCGYCVVTCPLGLLVMEEKFNSKGFFPAMIVDEDRCTGCAMCAAMCPEIAIEVRREE